MRHHRKSWNRKGWSWRTRTQEGEADLSLNPTMGDRWATPGKEEPKGPLSSSPCDCRWEIEAQRGASGCLESQTSGRGRRHGGDSKKEWGETQNPTATPAGSQCPASILWTIGFWTSPSVSPYPLGWSPRNRRTNGPQSPLLPLDQPKQSSLERDGCSLAKRGPSGVSGQVKTWGWSGTMGKFSFLPFAFWLICIFLCFCNKCVLFLQETS